MLDDMPKAGGTSLVAGYGDQFDATDLPDEKKKRSVARPRRSGREKVVKQSALGALLRPVGIALALVLSTYALLSIGTTFWRSYQRHLDHTAPVHTDQSVLDILFGTSNLPTDPVDLVVKEVDGTLHIVSRQWRANVDPYHEGRLYAALAYQRKRPGSGDWEPARPLVVPPLPDYSVWYHKLCIDRRGALFVDHVYFSVHPTYNNDMPGRLDYPALMMSLDGGDTWKLAETRDFLQGMRR